MKVRKLCSKFEPTYIYYKCKSWSFQLQYSGFRENNVRIECIRNYLSSPCNISLQKYYKVENFKPNTNYLQNMTQIGNIIDKNTSYIILNLSSQQVVVKLKKNKFWNSKKYVFFLNEKNLIFGVPYLKRKRNLYRIISLSVHLSVCRDAFAQE